MVVGLWLLASCIYNCYPRTPMIPMSLLPHCTYDHYLPPTTPMIHLPGKHMTLPSYVYDAAASYAYDSPPHTSITAHIVNLWTAPHVYLWPFSRTLMTLASYTCHPTSLYAYDPLPPASYVCYCSPRTLTRPRSCTPMTPPLCTPMTHHPPHTTITAPPVHLLLPVSYTYNRTALYA